MQQTLQEAKELQQALEEESSDNIAQLSDVARKKLRSGALGQARAAARRAAGEEGAQPVIQQLEALDAALKVLEREQQTSATTSRQDRGKGSNTQVSSVSDTVQQARSAAASLQDALAAITPDSELPEVQSSRSSTDSSSTRDSSDDTSEAKEDENNKATQAETETQTEAAVR